MLPSTLDDLTLAEADEGDDDFCHAHCRIYPRAKTGFGLLLWRLQFGFESFQVTDGQAAAIDFQHAFYLETR